ncbi:MAG: transcriptional repressor NrdR [Sedimentisphaerales bacterium]|nr:transcriptional repressor NrdR [Sedimentisphaerales bacterium]
MRCPYCKEDKDKVIDSRSSEGGRVVRRRRQCQLCQRRFTTYERIEELVKLTVVKKDGSRVPYNRDKIISGIQKACYKRPISMQQITEAAEVIEEEILRQPGQEVSSRLIGELTMQQVNRLDKVAYIRFASVYHEFEEVNQFIEEVQEVIHRPKDTAGQKDLFNNTT